MQIERITDAARLNAVVNDPSVYPWVRGTAEGPLDLGGIIADPRHVALMGAHGGCLFVHHQPGIFECHTQVLESGRGPWTLDMVRSALHWMFTRTDAVEIWTRCPKGNLGARALARAIGGQLEFMTPRGWVMDGAIIPASIFSLRIQDWMRDAAGLVDVGKWFHRCLDREFARAGRADDVHGDDEIHDRYVGAAVEMIRGGQPYKGAVFYNRFADMAGYERVKILGTDPVVVDIRNAVLEVHGQNFFLVSSSGSSVH
jgi:hypothetical protein